MKKTFLAALGYLMITFPLGYTWHLVIFKHAYEAFGVYSRPQPIIPLGVLSMLIQDPYWPISIRGGAVTGPA